MRFSAGLAVPVLLMLTCPRQWSQGSVPQSAIAKVTAKGRAPGTAFVVALRAGNAYLVTSAHVVEGDDKPRIWFEADSEHSIEAEVRHLEAGEERGLALLVVAKPPPGISVISAGLGELTLQSRVDIVGYPNDSFTIVDAAIASRKGRDIWLSRDTSEGFSGGPVLRLNGAVAGMVYGRDKGLGKAVGAANIKEYLDGHRISWGDNAAVAPPKPSPKPAGPQPGEERIHAPDGLTYVWIPPGTFTMGCSPGDEECSEHERPAHPVTISKGFWMSKSEVTQAAYQKVMGTSPSHSKGANRPVEQVSWTEANNYCQKIGGRLPTEAEWEYAARAGSTAARYGELDRIAWHRGNSQQTTHDVMTRDKNAFGLQDMIGNVWEWVSDFWGPYGSQPLTDPNGPRTGTERIVRGGSWVDNPQFVRSSVRNWIEVGYRDNDLGFRCAGEFR